MRRIRTDYLIRPDQSPVCQIRGLTPF